MAPASRPDPAPFTVGLTGGIGSGKSAAAHIFSGLGIELVDTDAIAHALTGPDGAALPAIREAFGTEVIRADGALDRAAMRARVFGDATQRRRLETILHPMIRAESGRQLALVRSPYAILAVPLLIESGDYRERCDRVLVVDCPEELQVARVVARSGMPAEEVRRIIAAQIGRDARRAAADDIVDNSGTLEDLNRQILALHVRYLAAAREAAATRVL